MVMVVVGDGIGVGIGRRKSGDGYFFLCRSASGGIDDDARRSRATHPYAPPRHATTMCVCAHNRLGITSTTTTKQRHDDGVRPL